LFAFRRILGCRLIRGRLLFLALLLRSRSIAIFGLNKILTAI
jgi:hypothetical protein